MQAKQKNMIKFLLFKWKQLTPYASMQRAFMENYIVNQNTICPFDFSIFDPMSEIDIIKTKIIDCSPKFIWAKHECDLPGDLCDNDLIEINSRYNYMLIEKIKRNVYKHQ